jgi:hypothetical protein
MWTIRSEDVALAKERIRERRAEIEAKYAEALKSLDNDLAELDAMERVAGDFAGKYAREEPASAAESEEAGTANGNEGGRGSRWRLHFSPARAEREESANT